MCCSLVSFRTKFNNLVCKLCDPMLLGLKFSEDELFYMRAEFKDWIGVPHTAVVYDVNRFRYYCNVQTKTWVGKDLTRLSQRRHCVCVGNPRTIPIWGKEGPKGFGFLNGSDGELVLRTPFHSLEPNRLDWGRLGALNRMSCSLLPH